MIEQEIKRIKEIYGSFKNGILSVRSNQYLITNWRNQYIVYKREKRKLVNVFEKGEEFIKLYIL